MRGVDERGDGLFSYVDLEVRVPTDHPLRAIRVLVDEALAVLSGDFAVLYSTTGRPLIAPEKLLRELLLQAFYTIRSERQLMEQLDYNLLFRWFVGLSMDAPVWDATVYSKNRDRLVASDVATRFLTDHGLTGRSRTPGSRPGPRGGARRRHAGRDQARPAGPIGSRRTQDRRPSSWRARPGWLWERPSTTRRTRWGRYSSTSSPRSPNSRAI